MFVAGRNKPTVRRLDLWPEACPGLVYYIHTSTNIPQRKYMDTNPGRMIELKADFQWAKQWYQKETDEMYILGGMLEETLY